MNEQQIKAEVLLRLTKAEALVLFDWLATIDEDKAPPLPFNHPSEEKVLWKIQGQLESTLLEPFQEDYKELLARARTTVEP